MSDFFPVIVSLSHHHAALALLESASFNEQKLELALRDLQHRPGVASGIILSTCNRIEIIATGTDASVRQGCEEFFHHWCGDSAHLRTQLRIYESDLAIRHLFSVAASVDSMVPGETQILGQLKEAYQRLTEIRPAHPLFDLWMRHSFSVAKRVRTETAIGAQAVSVAYAAVELASKIFSDLRRHRVLLLGAGEMAELTARHLLSRGIAELIICNRSYPRAMELAEKFSATAIPFDKLTGYLSCADIMIASTAADQPLLNQSMVKPLMRQRFNQPLFIIDMALPRNVAPNVNRIDNVYLYNLDDLKQVVAGNLHKRQGEIHKAAELIAAESEHFRARIERHRFHGLIGQIERTIKSIVEIELNRLLQQLDDTPRAVVATKIQRLIPSLVAKLLHNPSRYLREEGSPMNAAVLRQALLPSEEKVHVETSPRQPRK